MIIDKNIVSDVIIKLRNIVLFKLDNDILIMHIQCPRLKISIIIQAYFCGLFESVGFTRSYESCLNSLNLYIKLNANTRPKDLAMWVTVLRHKCNKDLVG